jgi:hypothetical protein
MPPTTLVNFGVPFKMLWNFSYHDKEGGGAPIALHASCSSQYSYLILVILSWHCFQMRDTSLGNVALILSITSFQSFAAIWAFNTPNASLPTNWSPYGIFH